MKYSVTTLAMLILIVFSINLFSQQLVVHFPFDNNADDQSGNGNDGTVFGATLTADRFGNPNAAYSFDGIDDYIEVFKPKNLGLTSWTISGWISINEIPIDPAIQSSIVGKHHNSEEKYNFVVHLSPAGYNGAPYPEIISQYEIDGDEFDHWVYYSLEYYNLNDWLFFTSVRDENTGRHALLINGILSEENWWTDVPTTSPENLLIGRINNDLPNFFNGIIDDIRIYNGALPDQGIDLIYILENIDLHHGIANSLWAKLNSALKSIDQGNTDAAINKLNAFINEVEAQRGKKISESDADALIAAAQTLIDNVVTESFLKSTLTQGSPANPEIFELSLSYLNPFDGSIVIQYELPEASHVNLSVYDASGQLIDILVNQHSAAGFYHTQWNTLDLPVGIYVAHLSSGGFSKVMKIMLQK